MNIKDIAEKLGNLDTDSRLGFDFDLQIIPGESEVLQVTLASREEMPVFITAADDQLLCIVYLWSDSEVKADKKAEMIELMLEMSIPMPLSSFSKIGDRYTVFGAMSLNSDIEEIVQEIVTLSDNSLDAIEVLSEYLQ